MVYFVDKNPYLSHEAVKLNGWQVNNRPIMAEHQVDPSFDSACSELCSSLGTDTFVVNPSSSMLTALVDWGTTNPDDFTTMRLLGDQRTLKSALGKFTVASQAADLIEDGLLEIRSHPDPPNSSIATDGHRLIVLIDTGETVGTLSTADREFVDDLHSVCSEQFEHAETYTLHTPPMSRIESSLVETLGPDRWEDFAKLIDATPFDGAVDEVIISLLVAAKHGDLLYDISKWGEDIGLASKATFSRKKSHLEDAALIETSSEPIDVGRPRLRLALADEALQTASAAEVIDESRRRLG